MLNKYIEPTAHCYKKKKKFENLSSLMHLDANVVSMCLVKIKKSVYFTIQFIFATIHRFHYTFWYYSWVPLYYFS